MGAANSVEVGKVVLVDGSGTAKGDEAKEVLKINTQGSRLLLRGNSVNDRDVGGNTYLHRSVKNRDLDAAQLALALGADVNIQNQGGCTALHMAVVDENADMVQLLVQGESDEGEIDLDVLDDEGMSPLHVAIMKNNASIVSILLQNGASVLGRTSEGQSPVELAISVGSHNSVQVLCKFIQEKFCGVGNQYQSEVFFLNAVRSFQILGLIEKYQQDIASARERMQNLAQEKHTLQRKLVKLGVNSMFNAYAVQQQQSQMEEALRQFQLDNQNLVQQVQVLKQEGQKSQQENSLQLKEIEEKDKEIVVLKSEKIVAEKLNCELQSDVARLRDELLSCKNSGDVMSQMLEDVQAGIQGLQEQVLDMATSEDQHFSDKHQLHLYNQKQAALNLQLSTEVGELQAMVQDLEKLYKAKQEECCALNAQIELLDDKAQNQLRDEICHATVYALEQKNLKTHYTQEQVQWLLDDRKKLQNDKNELCAQLYKLGQVEGGSTSLASVQLTKDLSEFQDSNIFSSYSTDEDTKSGLTAIVHKNQHTPRSMLIHSDSDDSGREIEELRMQIQELITQNAQLQHCIEQMKQEQVQMEQNNKDMMNEVVHLREHYDEMQFENVQLKSEIQELREMQTGEVLNKRVLARAPSLYKELSEQYETKIKKLQTQIESLSNKQQAEPVAQDIQFLKLEHQVVEQIQLQGLKYMKEEIEKLGNQLKFAKEDNVNLKMNSKYLQDQVEHLQIMVEQMKEENGKLKSSSDSLQEQLCCLQADYDDSERKVLQLRQVQQLLEEGNTLSHQDNCSLREQIRVLTAQICQMSVEKEHDATFYDHSKDQLQQKIQQLEDEVSLKDAKLVEFESIRCTLEKRVSVIAEQFEEKKRLQQQLVLLEGKYEALSLEKAEELEIMQNNIETESQQHIQKTTELQNIIKQLQEQESILKQKLHCALQEKIDKQKEVEELEVIVDETEEAVAEFQAKNYKIQTNMDNMQQILCELEKEKNEGEVLVVKLQEQVQQLHGENQEVSNLVDNMRRFINSSIENNGFQDTEKEGLVDKLKWFMEQVNNRLTETEAQKQEVQQKNNALMKNMEGVGIQFSELQKTRDRYAQQIQQMQQQILSLKMNGPQQLLDKINEIENNRKKMVDQMSELHATVGELQAEREYLQHEKDNLRTEMTEEFKRYEQQIKSLQQAKNKCTTSADDREIYKNYKKLIVDYDKINETNKMVMDKLHAAERDNDNLRDLNDSLIKKIKKNNNELQKSDREHRRLLRMCSKAEEARDMAMKENDKLLTSVQQLGQEQRQNIKEVDKLMHAVQEFEKEKYRLQDLECEKQKLQVMYGKEDVEK